MRIIRYGAYRDYGRHELAKECKPSIRWDQGQGALVFTCRLRSERSTDRSTYDYEVMISPEDLAEAIKAMSEQAMPLDPPRFQKLFGTFNSCLIKLLAYANGFVPAKRDHNFV